MGQVFIKSLDHCILFYSMTYIGPGGGDTLIFSYIRRLGSFFWVQIFEFQYFWGFSDLFIYFFFFGGGYEDLMIFWGVITKMDYI